VHDPHMAGALGWSEGPAPPYEDVPGLEIRHALDARPTTCSALGIQRRARDDLVVGERAGMPRTIGGFDFGQRSRSTLRKNQRDKSTAIQLVHAALFRNFGTVLIDGFAHAVQDPHRGPPDLGGRCAR